MALNTTTALLLQRQFTNLNKHPVEGFFVGLFNEDIFRWRITVVGPEGTLYESGFFTLAMTFPETYPDMPPKLRFLSKMWHPNVYKDGSVCISILHPPGDDPHGYEQANERWSPVQTVETIILSLISLLSSPNCDSPANVDAGKEWRDDKAAFKKRVRSIVSQSQEDVLEECIDQIKL